MIEPLEKEKKIYRHRLYKYFFFSLNSWVKKEKRNNLLVMICWEVMDPFLFFPTFTYSFRLTLYTRNIVSYESMAWATLTLPLNIFGCSRVCTVKDLGKSPPLMVYGLITNNDNVSFGGTI